MLGRKQAAIIHILNEAVESGVNPQFAVPPLVKMGRQQGYVIGLDNGNDAIKLAMLSQSGELFTLRIPTAHRLAEVIRGGASEVEYRVDGSQPFWIGETALRHDGDDLPIGPTKQRLIDLRLRHLIGAAIVELLVAAGYGPGEYPIVLGFAIPNTEIISEEKTEQLGVDPETRRVLEAYLKHAVWKVRRTDDTGADATWTLSILGVLPQAQTAGTLIVVTKAPNGATATDIAEMDIIDIGGGDLQHTTVQIKPVYRMTTRRLGDGTIRIARALKDMFPRYQLTDVSAQQALIRQTLLVSGRQRSIAQEVRDAINGQGQAIIGTVLPVLRQSRRFTTLTGGGVILLHDLLTPRLAAEAKMAGEDYLIINHGIASVSNAIGVMFGVIFRAAGRP